MHIPGKVFELYLGTYSTKNSETLKLTSKEISKFKINSKPIGLKWGKNYMKSIKIDLVSSKQS